MAALQAYYSIRVFMGCLATGINLLTLVCILKYRYLRTSANMLVGSLALSDFLHGIVTGVLFVFRALSKSWALSHVLCLVSICIEPITVYVQFGTFILLAFERRNSLLFQLNRSKKWNSLMLGLGLTSVWVVFGVANIAITILHSEVPENTVCSVVNYFPKYYLYVGIVLFVVSIVLITSAYTHIAWIVYRSSANVAVHEPPGTGSTLQDHQGTDMKITVMMALVVGVFFIVYCPFFLTTFTMTPASPAWHVYLFRTTILIYDINFWVNPFVYVWRDRNFKKAMRETFSWFWCIPYCRTTQVHHAEINQPIAPCLQIQQAGSTKAEQQNATKVTFTQTVSLTPRIP